MKNFQQIPGAPCKDFKGYCDAFLKCHPIEVDGPPSRTSRKKAALSGATDIAKATRAFMLILIATIIVR